MSYVFHMFLICLSYVTPPVVLGPADLYSGRPTADRACRIERQKIDFNSYVDLLHVPNLMHKWH